MQPPDANANLARIAITVSDGELLLNSLNTQLISIAGSAGSQTLTVMPPDGGANLVRIRFEIERSGPYAFQPPVIINVNDGDVFVNGLYDYTVFYDFTYMGNSYFTINVINTTTGTVISSDPALVNSQPGGDHREPRGSMDGR